MISRGWGSTVWSDKHLTYMINIALTASLRSLLAVRDDDRPT
jgi:hypothetical protein